MAGGLACGLTSCGALTKLHCRPSKSRTLTGFVHVPNKTCENAEGRNFGRSSLARSVHSETTVYRPFSRWPGAGKQEPIIDTSNGPFVCRCTHLLHGSQGCSFERQQDSTEKELSAQALLILVLHSGAAAARWQATALVTFRGLSSFWGAPPDQWTVHCGNVLPDHQRNVTAPLSVSRWLQETVSKENLQLGSLTMAAAALFNGKFAAWQPIINLMQPHLAPYAVRSANRSLDGVSRFYSYPVVSASWPPTQRPRMH